MEILSSFPLKRTGWEDAEIEQWIKHLPHNSRYLRSISRPYIKSQSFGSMPNEKEGGERRISHEFTNGAVNKSASKWGGRWGRGPTEISPLSFTHTVAHARHTHTQEHVLTYRACTHTETCIHTGTYTHTCKKTLEIKTSMRWLAASMVSII